MIDATHDMYQPARRARRRHIRETVMPPRNGTRVEKEAWMREKQAAKAAREQRKQAKEYNPDRHARSIIGALLKRHGIPQPRPVEPPCTDIADESGVWNI